MSLQELRKSMHTGVKGAWAKPEMLKAQDDLAKIARESIAKCYEECAAGGEPITTCYKKCAREAGLGDKFRTAWGKP